MYLELRLFAGLTFNRVKINVVFKEEEYFTLSWVEILRRKRRTPGEENLSYARSMKTFLLNISFPEVSYRLRYVIEPCWIVSIA